jgi:hypothetical protein
MAEVEKFSNRKLGNIASSTEYSREVPGMVLEF